MKENMQKLHKQKIFGNHIVELHCVENFNVSMITKTLILSLFK